MILDGFISGCMNIYCTIQEWISHSPRLVGYAFLTPVYSHTTKGVTLVHGVSLDTFVHVSRHCSYSRVLLSGNWPTCAMFVYKCMPAYIFIPNIDPNDYLFF